MLHALSDPARLEIVRRLAAGSEEWSCGTFELGLSKATLSHHFRVLREAGVVRTRPDGRKRLLSLREDDLNARFPGLLEAVLAGEPPSRSAGAGRGQRGRGRAGAAVAHLRARLPSQPAGAAASVSGSPGTRTQISRINLPHRLSPAARWSRALRSGPSLRPRLDVRAGGVWPLRALPSRADRRVAC